MNKRKNIEIIKGIRIIALASLAIFSLQCIIGGLILPLAGSVSCSIGGCGGINIINVVFGALAGYWFLKEYKKTQNYGLINLETFRVIQGNKISKVFTGRDRGKFVREKSKLEYIEQTNDIVEIIIPDNIYSINPSFFEELFVNVVKKLGKDEFLKKFKFTSLGDYDYEKPLNEAIDRILRSLTALD